MNKTIFGCILAGFVAVSTMFISCNEVSNTSNMSELDGTWVGVTGSFTETYIIDVDNSTFACDGNYEGNNLVVSFVGDDYGYMYFVYTKACEYAYSDPEDDSWTEVSSYGYWYRYSDSAPDCGKWYAVAFKNFDGESIDLSGAYKYDGVTSCDSLDEAMTEFTIDNGYFSYYSSVSKQ